MIKMIACDMDGTLLDNQKNFPVDFSSTVQKLKDKGVVFVCASGRSYCTLAHNFEAYPQIKDDMIYICDNGAYCRDNKRVFLNSGIKNEDVQEIITMCDSFDDIKVVLCGEQVTYHNINPDSDYYKLFHVYYENNQYAKDLHSVKSDFTKIAICDLKGIYNQCAKPLQEKFGEKFNVIVSGDCWLDINKKGVSKGLAIKQLQKDLNISEEETMVFGDYFNDVTMLQAAKYSFVMENAVDEMKQYGNFIAPKNTDNGVIKMIEKYVLDDKTAVK